MTKELLPIIAAYCGCKCSYTRSVLDCSDGTRMDGWEISNLLSLQNFKLHLRPLWSITEEELRELGEVLGLGIVEVNFYTGGLYSGKELKESVAKTAEICIYDDNAFLIGSLNATKIINHLRSKGFCLDQDLIDAGLVELADNRL